MTKNYVNMAFRNHKFSPPAPTAQPVVEQSLKSSIVEGVETFTRIDVDAATKPSLPSADDYRLSALLAAGAPLNYVNPQIFENPELEASHFVDTNLVDDISADSQVPDSQVPREIELTDPQQVTND